MLTLTPGAGGSEEDHGVAAAPSTAAPSATAPSATAATGPEAPQATTTTSTADDTARWLAGGALVLAAVAVAAALFRGRRA